MASLDNFQTGNGRGIARTYPTYQDRMRNIQHNLHSSQSSAWDVASSVPVAPVQPVDHAMRDTSAGRMDPLQTERVGVRDLPDLYVPLQPHVQRLQGGDTADGVILYQSKKAPPPATGLFGRMQNLFSRTLAPIRSYNRFHPYVRR